MEPNADDWEDEDLRYVEVELSKEYPNLSPDAVGRVVGVAKTLVTRSEGRVKLLSVARKHIAH